MQRRWNRSGSAWWDTASAAGSSTPRCWPPRRSATSSASSRRRPSGARWSSGEHPAVATLRLARGARGGRGRGGGDLHPGRHPHRAHRPGAGLGLAVVCDKPFALDAAAARRSVELAERLGLAAVAVPEPAVGLRLPAPSGPSSTDGALGELVPGSSPASSGSPPTPVPPPSGGGTLLDFGSHLVDQALVLLGPVASVYAEWRMRETGLDDDVFVALDPRERRALAPVGQLEPGGPGPAVPGHRHDRQLRPSTPMDGQEDALLAGDAGHRSASSGAPSRPSAGAGVHRGRRRRGGADRARALAHLLPRVRRGRPGRAGPGRPARRRRHRDRPRRRPPQRDGGPGRRPDGRSTSAPVAYLYQLVGDRDGRRRR